MVGRYLDGYRAGRLHTAPVTVMLPLFAIFLALPALIESKECWSRLGWRGTCIASWDCASLGPLMYRGYLPEPCPSTGQLFCCPLSSKYSMGRRQFPEYVIKRYYTKGGRPGVYRTRTIGKSIRRMKRKPTFKTYQANYFKSPYSVNYITEVTSKRNLIEKNSFTTAKPERPAENFCRQYEEFAWEDVAELSPKKGVLPVRIQNCPENSLETSVQIAEFPFMVGLGYEDKQGRTVWGCSGVLISDEFVLTTAHCTHPPLSRPVAVRLGVVRLNLREEDAGLQSGVSEVIPHPGYHPGDRRANLALVRLSGRLQLGPHLRPACLLGSKPPSQYTLPLWHKDDTISLKLLDYDYEVEHLFADPTALILQKSSGEEISSTRCDVPENRTNDYMCINVKPSHGKCQSETEGGEPLIYRDMNSICNQVVVGIAIDKLCTSDEPILFTKIEPYLLWIEKYVWS